MTNIDSFIVGLIGAFVIYFANYRHTRIFQFLSSPKEKWVIVVFDLIGFMICGGLVTLYVVNPESSKEAFMGGCTWQGFVGGTASGIELLVKKTVHTSEEENDETTSTP